MHRPSWKKSPVSRRKDRRLPTFDFPSKPYQDFSLSMDEQLTCLVKKWHTAASNGTDCRQGESTSKLW